MRRSPIPEDIPEEIIPNTAVAELPAWIQHVLSIVDILAYDWDSTLSLSVRDRYMIYIQAASVVPRTYQLKL